MGPYGDLGHGMEPGRWSRVGGLTIAHPPPTCQRRFRQAHCFSSAFFHPRGGGHGTPHCAN